MINFDGVNFSERRPEEVISFFWCSVYMYINYSLSKYTCMSPPFHANTLWAKETEHIHTK